MVHSRNGRSLLFTATATSGFAALLYQMIWFRSFSTILSATSFSFACVTAAFLLGLAVGHLSSGAIFSRWNSRLNLYTALEGGIALIASFISFLLIHQREAIVLLKNQLYSLWPTGSLAIDFFLTVCLLGVPTFLMGLTLPALAETAGASISEAGLYALNSFGGAIGALAAYPVFLGTVGFQATIVIAATLNVISGVCVQWTQKTVASAKAIREQKIPFRFSSSREIFFLSFLSGFIFFSWEQIWLRWAQLLLGTRIYVQPLILGVILALIAAASWLIHRLEIDSILKMRRIFLGSLVVTFVASIAGLSGIFSLKVRSISSIPIEK